MIAITARSLWARKRRLVATLLAVALGVAFLAGTLLLSDTLRANFDRLFTQADGGTNVVLRGATEIGSGNSARTGVDASLLPRVRAVPGVADAQPYLEGYGQLLGRDGKPIGGNGPPTQAANWVGDPALNPYRLVAGHAPRADDEVVINRGAARTGHLALGMTTTLLTPQPLRVHIVGISTFGTADGFGPGTFTGMTLDAARAHLAGPKGPGAPAELTEILVKASPGVPDEELAARLRPVLPAGVQAITGTQLATEDLDDINSGFLGFLSTGLTAFAAIALLVAAFSIYNTFSILAAQRGRESALLRALGGTRRQLAVAGLAETLVIGVVGSVAGWAGGIGIAALLKGVFDGFGFALPAGGLVLRASSSVLAVTVGVAATVLAGVLPALRASRVPPLAALRELDAEPARISRVRSALGFLLVAGGVGAVIAGTAGGGQGPAIAGAVGTLAGFVVLGPVAVRPAAALLGAPIAALRGVDGRLARDNALRNPRRTAATASALMVGVAVATLFTVIGASLKASATQGVGRAVTADLVVYQPGYAGSAGKAGFSPQLAADHPSLEPAHTDRRHHACHGAHRCAPRLRPDVSIDCAVAHSRLRSTRQPPKRSPQRLTGDDKGKRRCAGSTTFLRRLPSYCSFSRAMRRPRAQSGEACSTLQSWPSLPPMTAMPARHSAYRTRSARTIRPCSNMRATGRTRGSRPTSPNHGRPPPTA